MANPFFQKWSESETPGGQRITWLLRLASFFGRRPASLAFPGPGGGPKRGHADPGGHAALLHPGESLSGDGTRTGNGKRPSVDCPEGDSSFFFLLEGTVLKMISREANDPPPPVVFPLNQPLKKCTLKRNTHVTWIFDCPKGPIGTLKKSNGSPNYPPR